MSLSTIRALPSKVFSFTVNKTLGLCICSPKDSVTEDIDKANNKSRCLGKKQRRQQNKGNYLKEETPLSSQKIWESIAKNYEMIEGAQLSNSFIILMALTGAKEPLNTTQISELIAFHSKGQIYKISATLKDHLEHRYKREGYVEGVDLNNKSLYSITPKGKGLLDGWILFCLHIHKRQHIIFSTDIV